MEAINPKSDNSRCVNPVRNPNSGKQHHNSSLGPSPKAEMIKETNTRQTSFTMIKNLVRVGVWIRNGRVCMHVYTQTYINTPFSLWWPLGMQEDCLQEALKQQPRASHPHTQAPGAPSAAGLWPPLTIHLGENFWCQKKKKPQWQHSVEIMRTQSVSCFEWS